MIAFPLRSLVTSAFLAIAFGFSTLAYEGGDPAPGDFTPPPPRSPGEGLASLVLPEGLEARLVASEPEVTDPIHLDFGDDGSLWVVEMGDYPLGPGDDDRSGGRVRLLEDRDADGTYETSTVFLDGLPFPTSVMAWRDGVIVTAVPDIIFARDTDGDGVADERTIWLEGFRPGNQQHRANGPWWDTDGWLYFANGDSGGTVRNPATGEELKIDGYDLRYDPATGKIERLTGRTQYIRCRDDFGNWFGSNNSRPLFHFVLEDRHLRRNPHVVSPSATVQIFDEPHAPRVFPASESTGRYNDLFAANRITSACGPTIYRDTHIAGLAGDALVCEPVHNLVHRRDLAPDEASFLATRTDGEEESEFLASTDPWFRPCSVHTGPDGAIWVVDMYRFVIEHPEWIPDDWQAVLDLRAGHDRGRIYRIVPRGTESPIPRLSWSDLGTRFLLDECFHRNGPRRDRALRELLRRSRESEPFDEQEILGEFDRRLASCDSASVRASAMRLRLLLGLEPLAVFLDDPDSRVRAALLRVAADSPGEIDGDVVEKARRLRPETEEERLALALFLGSHEGSGRALGRIALETGSEHVRAACLAGLPGNADDFLTKTAGDPRIAPLLPGLAQWAVGAGEGRVIAELLASDQRQAAFAALLAEIDRRGLSLEAVSTRLGEPASTAIADAAPLVARARATIADTRAALDRRIEAVSLVARENSGRSDDLASLGDLLLAAEPPSLRDAAVDRLLRENAHELLWERWDSLTPHLRGQVVAACLRSSSHAQALLEGCKAGDLSASSIGTAERERLLRFPSGKIRALARDVFAASISPERGEVIARFTPALELAGDAERGRATFATLCAACHRKGGIGRSVGADLDVLRDRSGEALLVAILDPNRSIEDKYRLYQVETRAGDTVFGMILEESANSYSLALLDGSIRQIAREDVQSASATDRSAMPEGLEASLDPPSLADLIAFLQQDEPAPPNR